MCKLQWSAVGSSRFLEFCDFLKLPHPAPAMASLLSSGVPFLLPPDPILKDIFATIQVFPRQELPFYAMDAVFRTKSENVDL